jgi:beta-N-acetylhexosaminidase/D-alanyl-D-alanine dipeptidase
MTRPRRFIPLCFALILLLAAASRAGTPELAAAGLLDVTTLAPGIVLDIRYATDNNFTGAAVYPLAACYLRADAAGRLAQVQADLRARGQGLKVFDCYRPFSIQKKFWALVPDERYVAKPVEDNGRPVAGSKHNRGAAVDATLVDASGRELEMPSGFDDFSEKAHRGYPGASPAAQANARLLEDAMARRGFTGLPTEWWHFDAAGWESDGLLDAPLN